MSDSERNSAGDTSSRPQRPRRSMREAAVGIVRELREAGHVAYLAGGCVRDRLMGRQPKDYDIATDATPGEVKRLFRRSRAVGEAFGVMLVRKFGYWIETATFRLEWGYEDGRRPSEVAFTDAAHDAMRRDFTINGLFEDPLGDAASPTDELGDHVRTQHLDDGSVVIDYVGGIEDIERQVLRAIGDPNERFAEDYLRMLRAVRFAARFGFAIDKATRAAILSHAAKLAGISRERIGHEVRAMLSGPSPGEAIAWLQRLQLDGPTLQEEDCDGALVTVEALSDGVHGREIAWTTYLAGWLVDQEMARGLVGASDAEGAGGMRAEVRTPGGSVTLGWVADLRTRAKPRVDRWRKALCLTNEETAALRGAIDWLSRATSWHELGVAGRKRLLASPWAASGRQLLGAMAGHEEIGRLASQLDADAPPLLAEGVAPEPLVNGDDLIALGCKPGPRFGRLLEEAYDAQLERRIATRDEALGWLKQRAET